MLGISTTWQSRLITDGKALIDEILHLDLDGIELEYRITSLMLKEMLPIMRKEEIKIFSIHNFFPVPEGITPENGGGDVFLLSAMDEDERKLAVRYSTRTIQFAHELEAKVVVLHLARAPMDTIKYELFKFYDEKKIGSKEYTEAMRKFKQIREEGKRKNFDNLLSSLEKLLMVADRYNVYLGIENRYYFREYPNFDEIGYILEKFKGSRLGYWHDIGHAKVNENLGIVNSGLFLEAYGKHLLGVHLHDVKGYYDHLAPGDGEADFDSIKKYLRPDTIKIIEVHPKVEKAALIRGIKFLKDKDIC